MDITYGANILEIIPEDTSYRYRAVMGENAVTLNFALPIFLDLPVGSTIEFEGETYEMFAPVNPKKVGVRNFEYTCIFESGAGKLKKWKLRNPVDGRLKFDFTGKPHEVLQLIVDNLNERDEGWIVGNYITAVEKLTSFNHIYLYEALELAAETWETEFSINGKAVNLGKVEHNKNTPLTLETGEGKGIKEPVKRVNENESAGIEILYVQGGDRNIDYSKYGNKVLLLPKTKTLAFDGTLFEDETGFVPSGAREYVTDNYGYSIRRNDIAQITYKEDSLDLGDVYPSRVGEVTAVETIDEANHFYNIIDSTIPAGLNYFDCLIAGETMTMIFQSGMLAGREFEVAYVHANKRFEIVPADIDGQTMPNDLYIPQIGDKYAIFGIQLPNSYIDDEATKTGASWDLFREAIRYLYEKEQNKYSISAELDPIYCKENWATVGGKLVLGGYVNFIDPQISPDGMMIRIIGIKEFVNKPKKPFIELSNVVKAGRFSSSLKKPEQNEVVIEAVNKQQKEYTKRRYQDVANTAEMLVASLENFSGAINPVSVNAMQVFLGDKSLQLRFVDSNITPSVADPDFSYNANKEFVINLATMPTYIQHMTLGIDTVAPTHAPAEYKFWAVSDNFVSGALTGFEDIAYNVYAKCHKTNFNDVDFVLSETVIKMEDVANYYHFLLGFLNKEFEGERSFAAMYGYSEFLPGQATMNMLADADRKLVIDLANAIITAQNGAEIRGAIKFVSASGALKNVTEVETSANTANENAIKAALAGNLNLIKDGYRMKTGNGYPLDAQYYSVYLTAGKTYTFSARGRRVNTVATKLEVDLWEDTWASVSIIPFTETSLITRKATFIPTITGNYHYGSYSYPNGNGGDCEVEWVMLQEGSVFIDQNTVFKQTAEEEVTNKENLLEDSETMTKVASSNIDYIGINYPLQNGKLYTFSIASATTTAGATYHVRLIGTTSVYYIFTAGTAKQSCTFRVPDTGAWTIRLYTGIYGSTYGTATFNNIMLQEGPFATPWRPCLTTLTQALLGSTEINGGLVLSNLIMLKNTLGTVLAGLSGMNDNITLWGGGNYTQALSAVQGGTQLPVLLTKQGIDSVLGCFKVVEDGIEIQNGDMKCIFTTKTMAQVLAGYSDIFVFSRTDSLILAPDIYIPLSSNQTVTETSECSVSMRGRIGFSVTPVGGNPLIFDVSYALLVNGTPTVIKTAHRTSGDSFSFIFSNTAPFLINIPAGATINHAILYTPAPAGGPVITASFVALHMKVAQIYKGTIVASDGLSIRTDGTNFFKVAGLGATIGLSFSGKIGETYGDLSVDENGFVKFQ